mmetsp:Transcript_3879/g.10986  ORF Transcript_3879/g.10986 Transcript_3879/m.10986 type:complete len:232 (+) Transcript_3879:1911-2606(+)
MVHVKVKDCHPLDIFPPAVESVRCSDCDVVQEAKPMRAVGVVLGGDNACRAGMVPRRTDCAKGVACLPAHDSVHCPAHSACGGEAGLPGPVGHGCVGVKVADACQVIRDVEASLLYAFDVAPLVDPQDVHHVRRHRLHVALQPCKLGTVQDAMRWVRQDMEADHVLWRQPTEDPADQGLGVRAVLKAGLWRKQHGWRAGWWGVGRGSELAEVGVHGERQHLRKVFVLLQSR